MPASTFPHAANSPDLRTCRRCRSRVHKDSMSPDRPQTCMTCCEVKLPPASGHVWREDGTCRCGLRRTQWERAVASGERGGKTISSSPELAAGLYDYDEAEKAKNEQRRTA